MGTGIDRIAGQRDSVTPAEMNIGFLGADNISGDGDQARWSRSVALLHDADVSSLFGRSRLKCIGDDGDFIDARSFGGGINPDFCRRLIG